MINPETLTSRIVSLVADLYRETEEVTDGASHRTIGRLLYEIKQNPDVKQHPELAEALDASIRLMFAQSAVENLTASEWAEGLPSLNDPEYVAYLAKSILEGVQKADWSNLAMTLHRMQTNTTNFTHPEAYAIWGGSLSQILTDEDVPEETRARLSEVFGLTTDKAEADEDLSRTLENFFRAKCMRADAANKPDNETQVEQKIAPPENTTEESPVGQNFAQRENTTEESIFLRLREMAHKRVFDSTESQLRAMIRACDDLSIPPTFDELSDRTRRLLDRLLSHPDCPEGFEDAMQHMASEFSNNEYGNSGNVHIRGIFP